MIEQFEEDNQQVVSKQKHKHIRQCGRGVW